MKYIWWMYHNPSSFLLMDVCSASNFFHMQKRAALKVFCLPPRILHLWQYLYSIYAEEELICGTLCSSSNIPEPAMKVKVLVTQSCLTLCDPMDCSPSGSSVHGILQARILEGIAISFSRVSSWPRDRTWISRIAGRFFAIWAIRGSPKVYIAQLCLTLCDPMNCDLPGSSVHGILQARILEWTAVSSSRGSSHPGIEPRSPALLAEALLSELLGKANHWRPKGVV